MKDARLKAIVCHPGGKRALVPELLEALPRHSRYVEPFAGGASLYMAKPLAKANILADTDADLMRMYRGLDCKKLSAAMKKLRREGGKYLARLHKAFKSGRKLTPEQYWVLKSRSYACVPGGGFRIRGRAVRAPVSCPVQVKKLRKAKLLTADFREAMKRSRGKDTLVYLDPPYPGAGANVYKRGKIVDPKDVAEASAKFPGKVLVSYSDTPSVRRAFRGFWAKPVKTKSNLREFKCRSEGGKKGCAVQRELILANYRFKGAKKLGAL